MNICHELQRYADGEIAARDVESFEDHLAGCASCQADLLTLLQLRAGSSTPPPCR